MPLKILILYLLIFNIIFSAEEKPAEQVNGENGEATETVSLGDIIRITGLPENAAAAKQALLDLVPITIEVSLHEKF